MTEDIYRRKNCLHDAMNAARIAIVGVRKESLRKQAMAVASTVAEVVVDQGDTACKTPHPAEYIDKIPARRAKQQTGN